MKLFILMIPVLGLMSCTSTNIKSNTFNDTRVPASAKDQVIYTCNGSALNYKGGDQKMLDYKMRIIEDAIQKEMLTEKGPSFFIPATRYTAEISIMEYSGNKPYPTKSFYTNEFISSGARNKDDSLDSIAQSMPIKQGDFQSPALHNGVVHNMGLFVFDTNTKASIGRALFIIRSSRDPEYPKKVSKSSKPAPVKLLAKKDLKLNITVVFDNYQLDGSDCVRSENIQK